MNRGGGGWYDILFETGGRHKRVSVKMGGGNTLYQLWEHNWYVENNLDSWSKRSWIKQYIKHENNYRKPGKPMCFKHENCYYKYQG